MNVEYRNLPHGGGKVSTIGIGTGCFQETDPQEVENLFGYAMDSGLNIIDTVMPDNSAVEPIARALKGNRHKMVIQMHLGAFYPKGTYARTRSLPRIQKEFENTLKIFETDYADIGFIHYVDASSDFEKVMSGGIFDYARKLKKEGHIRYLGFSSHSAEISKRFIDTGEIDVFMFSINPTYDFKPSRGKLALSKERMDLYHSCEKRGVAITAMKVYGGGQLLNEKTSPFGKQMATPQCIQYALDRPAVISCLPGFSTIAEFEETLKYYSTNAQERDYSFIGNLPYREMKGVCIYCNHCLPCPMGIDIGLVNKYLDLYKAGDVLARDHYMKLKKHASDCDECGVCEKNCPFDVSIRSRMREAKTRFHATK